MIWQHIRILMVLALGVQLIKGADTNGETEQTNSDSPVSPERSLPEQKPLLLTPLIMNCSYDEAREKSQVELFKNIGINAHSGYITVNETINIFFVLVVGAKNDSSEPLLLWTQGGPGLSALFGLFLENGPMAIDENGKLSPRNNTLQKNMSVLYVDLPVGAGFSFTTHNDSYAKSLGDIVFSVMEFLKQFLQLFGYYGNRPFYLGGESYGARYSVAVANWMLSRPGDVSLSLKGVISGSGFLGPVLEIAESSRFLYEMSMVNETGRARFKQQFDTMKVLAANQSTALGAVQLLSKTIFTSSSTPTTFQRLTMFNDHASPLFTERPRIMYICVGVLNSSYMRQELHVGGVPFQYNNQFLLSNLAPDWLAEISPLVEKVLNDSSMLSYIGQLDTLFPSVNQKAYFAKLNWRHADMYRSTRSELWRKPNRHYGHDGYIKKVRHLTEVILLGMSHYSSAEKPDEVYYLITDFVASSSNTAKAEETLKKAEKNKHQIFTAMSTLQ